MLEHEITQIQTIAEDFWPKSTPSDLGLLRKLVLDYEFSGAKEALEEAKMESNFQTIPFPKIKSALKNRRQRTKMIGQPYCMWACHKDTGKECGVLPFEIVAQSEQGAIVGASRFIEKYYGLPTDYVTFFDYISCSKYRQGISHTLPPKSPPIVDGDFSTEMDDIDIEYEKMQAIDREKAGRVEKDTQSPLLKATVTPTVAFSKQDNAFSPTETGGSIQPPVSSGRLSVENKAKLDKVREWLK